MNPKNLFFWSCFIFFFSFFSLVVFAPEDNPFPEFEDSASEQDLPLLEEEIQEPELLEPWDDSLYLNSLNGNDLALALMSGSVTDLSLIEDQNLAEAIRSNLNSPSAESGPLFLQLTDLDFNRALRSDQTLLQNSELRTNFETRLETESFRSEINSESNKKVKAAWYTQYQIIDLGAPIEDYKSGKVTTGGTIGANFNPREHPGATVLETGQLRDAAGAVMDGVIFREGDNIIVEQGTIDLSQAQDKGKEKGNYLSRGGNVYFSGTYLSGAEVTVQVKGGQLLVKSTSVDIFTPTFGTGVLDKVATVSGTLTLYDDFENNRHLTLGSGSELIIYSEREESSLALFTLKVEKETDYYGHVGFCYDVQRSCVGYSNALEGNDFDALRLVARGDNKINLQLSGLLNQLELLEIPLIKDRSQVILNQGQMVISKSFPLVQDPALLNSLSEMIVTYFSSRESSVCQQTFSSRAGQSCMTSLEYEGMQSTKGLYEKHQALLKSRGFGEFYGVRWIDAYYLESGSARERRIAHLKEKKEALESSIASWQQRLEDDPLQKEHSLNVIRMNKEELQETETLLRILQSPPRDLPRETHCIGYVEETLNSFTSSSERSLFINTLKRTDSSVPFAMEALVEGAGWEAYFYAPDVQDPEDGGTRHGRIYQNIKQDKIYNIYNSRGQSVVDFPVQETVIDYLLSPFSQEEGRSVSVEDRERLEILRRIPYAIGETRYGEHSYILSNGLFYEVHWTEGPESSHLIDASSIDGKITTSEGKEYLDWDWQSGIVVAPPGAWQRAKQSYCNDNPLAHVCDALTQR